MANRLPAPLPQFRKNTSNLFVKTTKHRLEVGIFITTFRQPIRIETCELKLAFKTELQFKPSFSWNPQRLRTNYRLGLRFFGNPWWETRRVSEKMANRIHRLSPNKPLNLVFFPIYEFPRPTKTAKRAKYNRCASLFLPFPAEYSENPLLLAPPPLFIRPPQ